MISIPSMVAVPLRTDQDGAIRIGQTRVLLELVIRAFNRGETPEGIVQAFPSVKLDEVYAVLAYYLQNRSEVDAYVRQVEVESGEIRQKVEALQSDMSDLRARLLKHLENHRKS